jgi:predicted transcriptional regulator
VKRAVIRLPSEIVDRLDQLAEELTASWPGKKFSRASVIRVLLSRGFGAVAADREHLASDLEGEPIKRGRKARGATLVGALAIAAFSREK